MRDCKFIATEPLGMSGEAGEKQVWDVICETFASRNCLGYWRYPIFSPSGRFRKEPDILIADADLGLIVIEVKSIRINQIVGIAGHRWEFRDFYTSRSNPYQQAENQLWALLEYGDREPSLQRQISGRAIIALPLITKEQWQQRSFDKLPTSPPIIFQNHLRFSASLNNSVLSILEQTPPLRQGNPLNEQQWKLLQAIIGGTELFEQNSSNRWRLYPTKSRAEILTKARQGIHELDLQQERIAKQIPPGAQRIRGIAGSGKTVILCQKAAHMHLKYPHWDIAFVFFSRSLYQHITEQLNKWLSYFSNDKVRYRQNNRKLRILHAWGSQNQPGLYRFICRNSGSESLTVSDTESKSPNESLAEVCIALLKDATIPQLFDAILIDEGQDFIVNDEFKFEEKQPFYWLAYQALRPANITHPEQRRLIWAYDEAQSTESLNVPTASELFGEKLGHLVTGQYPGGIKKSEIMYKCYRTPGDIITAAHAIGMGLLRPEGMLTGITRVTDWKAIGYEVSGRFISGEQVTIRRDRQNSPNIIPDLWENPVIEFHTYPSRQAELTALANKIIANLRQDGLKPSRDILVIVLGTGFETLKLETYVANFLLKQGIDIYIPSAPDCNIIASDRQKSDPNRFWCEGGVTVSRIHRAKGNEAEMVYLVGLDNIAKNESNIQPRNQLVVGLTRARGWVNLSGIGDYPLYEEMQQVIQSGTSFTFTFKRPPKREISITDAGELLKRYAAGGRNFQNADLRNARLVDADLRNANLIGTQLMGANLRNAQLDGVKLVIADLTGADLTGASLRKAKLMRAILRNARLEGVNLSRADLSDADLQGADLSAADLSEANLAGTSLPNGITFDA